jgi:hypothetical protein
MCCGQVIASVASSDKCGADLRSRCLHKSSLAPTGVGLVISPRSPRMEEFYRQAVEQPATIARIFGVLGGSIRMRELVSR